MALSFLLSAPAVNPVVLAATLVAFPGMPQVAVARLGASLLTALVVGWVRIAKDGLYLRYVTGSMRWPLVAAGLVVTGLAIVDAARDVRDGPHNPGADHLHVPGVLTWLVAVPALTLLFVGPTPVTARGADGALTGTAVSASDGAARREFPPLPPGDTPEIGFSELSQRAALDSGGSLDDREVTLVGTLLRDDAGTRLGRVAITCCAADARLVAVRVTDAASLRRLEGVADGGWVRTVVRVLPGSATKDSGYVPAVRVEHAEPVAEPERPYDLPRIR